MLDLLLQLFIFSFELIKLLLKCVCLLFSLLSGDSGTLAVLDEAILAFWEHAAHHDETLDSNNIKIDLPKANLEDADINLFDRFLRFITRMGANKFKEDQNQ